MNIAVQKQQGPYNQKQTSANAFFPLMPSANEVEVGNESFEQMEARYFLELQNPQSVFAMHYHSYVAYESKWQFALPPACVYSLKQFDL